MINFTLTAKSNKIFTIKRSNDVGDLIYHWFSTDTMDTLISNMTANDGMQYTHDNIILKKGDDLYPIINIILELLYDGYNIYTEKNRSGIEIKDYIMDKFIMMVRKYYRKNKSLDNAFSAFLKYYSYDDVVFMKTIMNDINILISNLKISKKMI